MLNPNEVKIVLEAALLAAQEPLPVSELRKMFDEEIGADTIRRLLEELREAWKDRGVELAAIRLENRRAAIREEILVLRVNDRGHLA